MTVALFGGSFNPITNAHIDCANAVLDQLKDVDEIWLMPTYHHKFGKDKDYFDNRIELLNLIATDKIKVFDWELKHKSNGSTFETISQLLNDPDYEGYKFYFIIGADCVLDFPNWNRNNELKNLITFIVFPRYGYDLEKCDSELLHPPHIFMKQHKGFNISSTDVRNKLKNNESITGMVPDIIEEKLFHDLTK